MKYQIVREDAFTRITNEENVIEKRLIRESRTGLTKTYLYILEDNGVVRTSQRWDEINYRVQPFGETFVKNVPGVFEYRIRWTDEKGFTPPWWAKIRESIEVEVEPSGGQHELEVYRLQRRIAWMWWVQSPDNEESGPRRGGLLIDIEKVTEVLSRRETALPFLRIGGSIFMLGRDSTLVWVAEME